MSNFSTEGVKTAENVSKFLSYGINFCKIVKMTVIKAKNTESRKIQFSMEGAPMGKDFQGIDGAKGKVGRVETGYMKEDKAYQDFMRQVGIMADKLGVRKEVDAVKASTIEDYIAQVEPLLKGKFAWWMFGGEEWAEKKWGLRLLKFGFIKAESEINAASLKTEGFINTEVLNNDGVVAMRFDKANHFHYAPFVKSEDGDAPSAQSSLPNLGLPFNSVDDLPFGPVSNKPSDLPFDSE